MVVSINILYLIKHYTTEAGDDQPGQKPEHCSVPRVFAFRRSMLTLRKAVVAEQRPICRVAVSITHQAAAFCKRNRQSDLVCLTRNARKLVWSRPCRPLEQPCCFPGIIEFGWFFAEPRLPVLSWLRLLEEATRADISERLGRLLE